MARSQGISNEASREKKRLREAARRSGQNMDADGTVTLRDDVARLYGAFGDILDCPKEEALSFFKTAGIASVLQRAADDVWPAFLAHYMRDGAVDEERFAIDYSMWPPVASRVAEIRAGRA